jgi:excisionase family DNA binding protein
VTELIVTTREQLSEIIRQAVRAELGGNIAPAQWLDTTGAAAILRIHPKTVGRLARTGELQASRLGRSWRFRQSDLEEFLEAGGER